MIKCPNPNCGSLIPDDSKFCPDCRTRIVNEESIRKEATDIATKYSKGYQYYVNNGSLPQLSHWLNIEAYKQIVSYKQQIVSKQKEFIEVEKAKRDAENKRFARLAEETRRRNNAEQQKLQKSQYAEKLWEQEKDIILKQNTEYLGLSEKKYKSNFPGKLYATSIVVCFIIGFCCSIPYFSGRGSSQGQELLLEFFCGCFACILSPLSLLFYCIVTGNSLYGISTDEEVIRRMLKIEEDEKVKFCNRIIN